jgi:hypothetical protein
MLNNYLLSFVINDYYQNLIFTMVQLHNNFKADNDQTSHPRIISKVYKCINCNYNCEPFNSSKLKFIMNKHCSFYIISFTIYLFIYN